MPGHDQHVPALSRRIILDGIRVDTPVPQRMNHLGNREILNLFFNLASLVKEWADDAEGK